jgi:putative endonuclease
MRKMYYVYVLVSFRDGRFYTGFTHDLERRIEEHNAGRVTSTAMRVPLELVYYEACLDRADAVHREKYLKTTFGKHYIRNRIKNCLAELGINT